MKKGFSAFGVLCIIAVIGLATFACLVSQGIIKINRESKIDIKPETDIYINQNKEDIQKEGTDIYNKQSEKIEDEGEKMNLSKDLNFVYSLEDKTDSNTVWCGTFNLIWNLLKDELAKKDIIFENMTDVVINLNKGTFSEDDLDEDCYYITYGYATKELKNIIEKAIKDKFNETSDILESFDFLEDSNDYFLYTMLKKEFKFKYKFDELENGKFKDTEDVKYFGIRESSKEELKDQVEVLYYDSDDSFAVKLKTKTNDEIILNKSPKGNSFYDIYNNILNLNSEFDGNMYLDTKDTLKVPYLKLDALSEVKEVENKPFSFANGESYYISKALQTIKFELDSTGGKIKSEAAMMVRETAALITEPEEIRHFNLDDEFVIFLKEKDSKLPYFAAKINDITKFN